MRPASPPAPGSLSPGPPPRRGEAWNSLFHVAFVPGALESSQQPPATPFPAAQHLALTTCLLVPGAWGVMPKESTLLPSPATPSRPFGAKEGSALSSPIWCCLPEALRKCCCRHRTCGPFLASISHAAPLAYCNIYFIICRQEPTRKPKREIYKTVTACRITAIKRVSELTAVPSDSWPPVSSAHSHCRVCRRHAG